MRCWVFDGCCYRLLITLLLAAIITGQATAIDTVPELNITQYLGTWYQVFGVAN